MKLISSLLILLLSSIALICAEKRVIVEDNFENPEDVKLLKLAKLTANPQLTENPDEVISGKASVVFDSMATKDTWPNTLRITKEHFKKDKLYICSFDYKILALGKGKRNHVFFNAKLSNGKSEMLNYQNFGKEVGDRGTMTCVASFPKDAESIELAITSYNGARIAIDNFKLEEKDWNGDWFFDKEKKIFFGMKHNLTEREYAKLDDPIFEIPQDKFFPMCDKYGQFKHRNWDTKVSKDEDLKAQIETEAKYTETLKPIKGRDKFGGYINPDYKFEPTERFTTRKVNGKWFFVTPEGNLFWSLGVNSVGSSAYTTLNEREFYFEDLDKKFIFPGKHHPHGYGKVGTRSTVYSFDRRNDTIKYGTDKAEPRAERNIKRMKDWGLNTIGAWADPNMLKAQELPYIVQVNSARDMPLQSKAGDLVEHWTPFPDFFRPDFEEKLAAELQKNIELINSPYCIGILVDNELPWQGKNGMVGRALLTCPPEQFTKIAFKNALEKKYASIEKLNAAWGTSFKDWQAFLDSRESVKSDAKEFSEDMEMCDQIIAEKYFTSCRNAIKGIAPNALYISCRFAWRSSIPVIEASKICDVVAMNLYGLLPSEKMQLPEGFEDKPLMIGEFTFARVDQSNFGVYGACACRSQQERLDKYDAYITDALTNPYIIGAHWFQWRNQPVTGRPDGEHFAFGLVDICDNPEYPMIDAIHDISSKMYKIRLKKPKGAKKGK